MGEFFKNVDWLKVGKIALYVVSGAASIGAKVIGDHQRDIRFDGAAERFFERKFEDLNFMNKESL